MNNTQVVDTEEENTLSFKTNIKCGGCIAQVKPILDAVASIKEWNVDIANADKILTVKAKGISESEIVETIQKAGFKIERIRK